LAQWLAEAIRGSEVFDVELVDLADFKLPVFDEPEHPRLQKYAHEHTKRWSASVASAHAFVFVTPEYNYAPPPSLVNALDYLVKEWAYKPVGFFSYGGPGGGLRAGCRSQAIHNAADGAHHGQPASLQPGADRRRRHVQAERPPAAGVAPMLAELHKLATVLKPLRWQPTPETTPERTQQTATTRPVGREKPALDADGQMSATCRCWSRTSPVAGAGKLKALAAIDLKRMPLVPSGTRLNTRDRHSPVRRHQAELPQARGNPAWTSGRAGGVHQALTCWPGRTTT
jgi:NAD(P)H-dependent FMN reductase